MGNLREIIKKKKIPVVSITGECNQLDLNLTLFMKGRVKPSFFYYRHFLIVRFCCETSIRSGSRTQQVKALKTETNTSKMLVW